jgi:hypothetical protein
MTTDRSVMAPLASRPVSTRSLLRRRWPRYDVIGHLVASIPELDVTMIVRDLSLGGFAADGMLRFARGESYALTITGDGESPYVVRARVAWYHGRDREERFFTGWEVLGDPDSTRAMAELVARFTAASASTEEHAAGAHAAAPPPRAVPPVAQSPMVAG